MVRGLPVALMSREMHAALISVTEPEPELVIATAAKLSERGTEGWLDAGEGEVLSAEEEEARREAQQEDDEGGAWDAPPDAAFRRKGAVQIEPDEIAAAVAAGGGAAAATGGLDDEKAQAAAEAILKDLDRRASVSTVFKNVLDEGG